MWAVVSIGVCRGGCVNVWGAGCVFCVWAYVGVSCVCVGGCVYEYGCVCVCGELCV